MKDKYGLEINIGDLAAVIDAIGIVMVSDIHEDRDCISYRTSSGRLAESSSGAEFRALCDPWGKLMGINGKDASEYFNEKKGES